jgi:hypothetical protein
MHLCREGMIQHLCGAADLRHDSGQMRRPHHGMTTFLGTVVQNVCVPRNDVKRVVP